MVNIELVPLEGALGGGVGLLGLPHELPELLATLPGVDGVEPLDVEQPPDPPAEVLRHREPGALQHARLPQHLRIGCF